METRKVSELKVNPQNPRGWIGHDVALRELAMSIQSQGVLQPIIITPNNVIVAGHRRVKAAALVGVETVPVIIKTLSKSEQLQWMLIENLQREDLTLLQEGASYARLIETGLTPSQVSKAIGIPGQRISDCLAVQQCPPAIQRMFALNELQLSCASPLAAISNEEDQLHWAAEAVKGKYSGTRLRAVIDAEGKPRKIVANPNAVIEQAIIQLKHMDERLDFDPKLRGVQTLLRQAVLALIKSKEKAA
jgi:ParB family chromosome partitioning protein